MRIAGVSECSEVTSTCHSHSKFVSTSNLRRTFLIYWGLLDAMMCFLTAIAVSCNCPIPIATAQFDSFGLRELSDRFGLSHPDSASDLIWRGAKRIEQSTEAVRQQTAMKEKLSLNPESRA